MTDYNDGKWHNAEGDEWPLHEKTMAYRLWRAPETDMERLDYGAVGSMNWGNQYSRTTAFRVVKEYREPREWWIVAGAACSTEDAAREMAAIHGKNVFQIVHVREVKP